MALIVMVAALQPTLLFHFCHGTLAEVAYPIHATKTACCEMDTDTDTATSQLTATGCCSEQLVQLTTDHFLQTAHINIQSPMMWVAISFALTQICLLAGVRTTVFHPIMPPLWARHGLSVLRRLCIYRI